MFAPDAPEREFVVQDIILDGNLFPAGWINDSVLIGPPCYSDIPGEEVFAHYFLPGEDETSLTKAVETICKVDKTWRASLQYERLFDLYVFSFLDGIWIDTPLDISFESEFADEWDIKCQRNPETDDWQRCVYFARYKEFLVEFDVWTGNSKNASFMTFDEFDQILYNIDKKMGTFVYLEDQN